MPRRSAKPAEPKPYNPPPPGGYADLCGVCRRPIEQDGRCADCGGWPFTVWLVDRATGVPLRDEHTRRRRWAAPTPPRACPGCGDPIGENGACQPCRAQVGPGLLHPCDESPIRGIWVEAEGEGPFPIPFLSVPEAKARLRAIIAGLRGEPMPVAPVNLEAAKARFKAEHPTLYKILAKYQGNSAVTPEDEAPF